MFCAKLAVSHYMPALSQYRAEAVSMHLQKMFLFPYHEFNLAQSPLPRKPEWIFPPIMLKKSQHKKNKFFSI